MWIFLLGVLALLVYGWRTTCERQPHFPPGPRHWPFIGSLGAIALKLLRFKCHHLVWEEWGKRYGNVVGLKLGPTDMVVVYGKDLIREVAGRPEFDGRPGGFFYTMRSFGKKAGIVFADGPSWFQRRKVVLKYLRNFGYGSRLMESSILAETESLERLLQRDAGKPVDVNSLFDISVVNILWGFVSGQRYELTDERLLTLCRLMKRSFKVVDMSGGILNCMPWLRHIMPDLIGYTELKSVLDALHQFLAETIMHHKTTLNVNQPRDMIDAFLIDMMQHKNDPCTDEELQVVCLDLLQAGAETVSNTLVFLVLYMIRHPDVQERVYREIDQVCGRERGPVVDDRIRMPFTEAVTMEVLRISTVAPVGIVHVAMNTANLGEYVIPKGTLILLSIYNMHMNKYWNDADTFRPERFLDNASGLVMQDDWLMPFGAGKRRCIGEALARAELFLFFTSLLQKFQVMNPDGCPLPDAEPLNGVTLSAKPFKAIFKTRQ